MRRVKCQEQIRFKEKSSHSSVIPQLTRMGRPWNSGPVVSTSLGKVEGSLFKSENGNKIYSYRGIPYGAPPLGERRFKKPEPVSSWKHTLDCRREAKKSLQPHVLFPNKPLLAEGGEDCLYLSVFTRSPPGRAGQSAAGLPVVVFFHGGAFMVGSCQADLYGPQVIRVPSF